MFIIVDDGSGDMYVIPEDKEAEWEKFVMCFDDIYGPCGQYPEWAHYVGGFANCVRFSNWEAR